MSSQTGFMTIINYFIVQLCHLPKRTDFVFSTSFTEKWVIFAKWHSRTTKYKLGITVVHIRYSICKIIIYVTRLVTYLTVHIPSFTDGMNPPLYVSLTRNQSFWPLARILLVRVYWRHLETWVNFRSFLSIEFGLTGYCILTIRVCL